MHDFYFTCLVHHFMHISPKFSLTYLISLETLGSPLKSKNQKVKNQVGLVRLGSMPHNHNACASITLSLPMLPVSLHSQKIKNEKKIWLHSVSL